MDVERLLTTVLEAEKARYVALLNAYAALLQEVAELRARAPTPPAEDP